MPFQTVNGLLRLICVCPIAILPTFAFMGNVGNIVITSPVDGSVYVLLVEYHALAPGTNRRK